MAVELFLVPMEGSGTISDPRRAKYSRNAAVVIAASVRFSPVDSAVLLLNASQAYLDSVRGQVDATSLATPANLDNVLTAEQANAAKAIFDDLYIPSQFVNAGDTRRQVIRGLIGMFMFAQRMASRFGVSWKQRAQNAGLTLDSMWSQFPQVLQNEFISIRDSFGWGNLGLNGSSTLRQIMSAVGRQFERDPITIGGVVI